MEQNDRKIESMENNSHLVLISVLKVLLLLQSYSLKTSTTIRLLMNHLLCMKTQSQIYLMFLKSIIKIEKALGLKIESDLLLNEKSQNPKRKVYTTVHSLWASIMKLITIDF